MSRKNIIQRAFCFVPVSDVFDVFASQEVIILSKLVISMFLKLTQTFAKINDYASCFIDLRTAEHVHRAVK